MGLHSAPSFVTWARWLEEKRVYSLGSVALLKFPALKVPEQNGIDEAWIQGLKKGTELGD